VAADAVELRPVTSGVARVLRVGRHAHRFEPVAPARVCASSVQGRMALLCARPTCITHYRIVPGDQRHEW
jgi:hypothetical protein